MVFTVNQLNKLLKQQIAHRQHLYQIKFFSRTEAKQRLTSNNKKSVNGLQQCSKLQAIIVSDVACRYLAIIYIKSKPKLCQKCNALVLFTQRFVSCTHSRWRLQDFKEKKSIEHMRAF